MKQGELAVQLYVEENGDIVLEKFWSLLTGIHLNKTTLEIYTYIGGKNIQAHRRKKFYLPI